MEQRIQPDYEGAYRQHTTSLRHWFLAYGVGGPVLFVGNEHIWARVEHAPGLASVGETFFAGVAVQIVLSYVDKYAAWVCHSERVGRRRGPWKHCLAKKWIEDWDWPSMVGDAATALLFGVATVRAFELLVR